ncbi:ankyrin repeat domain-containing protein [Conexibacter woesei]|uniref:ankyrin repeat domain-containing protein n=1 Tax=Conexibacter woesei TaxID=191495 RepID=UPI000556139B|nr:ankyrin repeat domain-containing protein [Conexibacter woesei]
MERLHREAKKLASAHARGEAEAVARAAEHRNDARKPLKLAGAQAVVAGEHGFSTWQRLRAYVEREEIWGEGLEHAFQVDVEYYEGRADGLLASAGDRTPGALARFEGEGQELTPAGARAVVARRHGFETWSALKRHVVALDEDGDPFRRAYLAVESGADGTLRQLLERFPELARANGTNGNALINMATDPGCVRTLLEAGADVAHANAHGWTPLHQAAYGDNAELAELLLSFDAPADVSGRGAGGTPLIVALFWGHHAVTEVLLRAGRWPDNLRVAAGTGDVARIAELVHLPDVAPSDASASVTEAAGALRSFYRPHGGFPAWAPSDDPQEILDEALAWAARSDRVEAIRALAERGAQLDADVYRGTALTWAAATGRTAAISELVSLGAAVDGRSTFGGPTHGEGVTPLHLAAQSGHTEAVKLLLSLGADPSLRDALHNGDAAGWAEVGDHPTLAALLRDR